MDTTVRTSNKGVRRGGFAIAALLTLCALVMAWNANPAKAAQGDPFGVDFNYVGLNVDTSLTEPLYEMVLSPPETPLEMRGTYDDNAGNFTLPKDNGLIFPDAEIVIEGATITGKLGLTEPAKGNYNSATGVMTLKPKISLTLGTDNVRAFPPELLQIVNSMLPPGSDPYPLACEFSPLVVDFSTGHGWPSPGKTFTGTDGDGQPTEGAIAGFWDTKPKVKALAGGTMCSLIGSLLDSVGGIWLSNSSDVITDLPDATSPPPPPAVCAADETGTPPDCKPRPPAKCDPPLIGNKPDCKEPEDEKKAEITKVAIAPAKGKIKAGKALKVKVRVTNTGDAGSGSIKVNLKSSNKQVKLPKSFSVDVAAGATVTKTITVKAGKKAKGKATLTASYGTKSGKSVLTVQKAKKKKAKKKSKR